MTGTDLGGGGGWIGWLDTSSLEKKNIIKNCEHHGVIVISTLWHLWHFWCNSFQLGSYSRFATFREHATLIPQDTSHSSPSWIHPRMT